MSETLREDVEAKVNDAIRFICNQCESYAHRADTRSQRRIGYLLMFIARPIFRYRLNQERKFIDANPLGRIGINNWAEWGLWNFNEALGNVRHKSFLT